MLADPRIRRLATEFACQWLHIYDFDSLSEKSEKFFPEFTELRGDMYEESILFFTDLFQTRRLGPQHARGRSHLRQRPPGPVLRHAG